ncbi:MAG: hypothetical protein JNL70_11815 [Saprospiraceae bacterium]|nr:hypothetical protein [Saprospiraceae bacterium]
MTTSNITTRSQLANYYGISVKTLNRWLQKFNITLSAGHIPPIELEEVFEKLGHPKNAMSDFGATLPISAKVYQ